MLLVLKLGHKGREIEGKEEGREVNLLFEREGK